MRRPALSGACRERSSSAARLTASFVSKPSRRLSPRPWPADHYLHGRSPSLSTPLAMRDFDSPSLPASTPDFEAFRRHAYQIAGIDLTCYKVPQMHRRLSTLLTRVRVPTFAEYGQLLEHDLQRRQEFRDFVTINVSEFFRDSDRFSELERRVNGLIGTGGALRAWS